MKSRQKTWRDVNNYIPEKGTASLRENLKTMRSDHSTTENKRPSLMKKANLPTNPAHALEQLRVWAQLEEVEDSFTKMFLVSELLWLIFLLGHVMRNFQNKVRIKELTKKFLVKNKTHLELVIF